MGRFKALFGMDPSKVQKTCVLLPFLPPKALSALGVKALANGVLFSSANTDGLTVIRTGAGAGFIGDATLYLEESPVKNILFFGSCGLINTKLGLDIGSLVVPTTAYAIESFSDIALDRTAEPVSVRPDPELLSDFLEATRLEFQPSACVSFGSLYHEDNWIPVFKRLGADIIEMECAALFHAARKAQKQALAILFIADILADKPFYEERKTREKKMIADGIARACQGIKKFVSK